MQKAVRTFLVLVVASSLLACSTPATAVPTPSAAANGEVFGGTPLWFIHVTDTQGVWRHQDERERWAQFLNESLATIRPSFVVNTGDLVDSDYFDFFRRGGQQEWEWTRYRESLDAAGMNLSVYIDLMGNHDAYRDPQKAWYLNYSVLGRATGQTQHAWRKNSTGGEVAFVGLHTPEDNGIEYPFGLFGYLNRAELDWYEQRLAESADASLTIAFGHHPPYEVVSSLSSSWKTWGQLNRQFGVDFYFVGHGHVNSVEDVLGMVAIETARFEGNAPPYRVVAVDGPVVSSQVVRVGQWPQAVITSPAAEDHVYGDLDRDVLASPASVRVLAWDPAGVSRVEVRASGGAWVEATRVGSTSLYEAPVGGDLRLGGGARVETRVTGGSGQRIFAIYYRASPRPHWTWLHGIVAIWGAFLLLAFVLPGVVLYGRRKDPVGRAKKPDHVVDAQLKRLFLAKLACFLFVPYTVGLMLFESPTLVFGFFYATSRGFFFYSTNLIYTAVLWGSGILGFGLNLSPARRRVLAGHAIASLFLLGLVWSVYLSHFPTVAWIAPGIVAMGACDVLALRRGAWLGRNRKWESEASPA